MSPTITPMIRLVRLTSARASSLGAVAELLGGRQHAVAGRVRHGVRRAVEHARRRGDRDVGAAADVGQGSHVVRVAHLDRLRGARLRWQTITTEED